VEEVEEDGMAVQAEVMLATATQEVLEVENTCFHLIIKREYLNTHKQQSHAFAHKTGSGYIGGCMTGTNAYTAPGSNGATGGNAQPINTADASYAQGVGIGGLPGTSTSTSFYGNGGNGFVVITPVTSTASAVTTQYFYSSPRYAHKLFLCIVFHTYCYCDLFL